MEFYSRASMQRAAGGRISSKRVSFQEQLVQAWVQATEGYYAACLVNFLQIRA